MYRTVTGICLTLLNATTLSGVNLCESKLQSRFRTEIRECRQYTQKEQIQLCLKQKTDELKAAKEKCTDAGFRTPVEEKRDQWRRERAERKKKAE